MSGVCGLPIRTHLKYCRRASVQMYACARFLSSLSHAGAERAGEIWYRPVVVCAVPHGIRDRRYSCFAGVPTLLVPEVSLVPWFVFPCVAGCTVACVWGIRRGVCINPAFRQ